MQKTFTTPQGLVLAKLATFTHYIENVQFRFVVTQENPLHRPAVTHRVSGSRVCYITPTIQAAALGDMLGAGKLAIEALIKEKGAARVFDVLSHAEKATA